MALKNQGRRSNSKNAYVSARRSEEAKAKKKKTAGNKKLAPKPATPGRRISLPHPSLSACGRALRACLRIALTLCMTAALLGGAGYGVYKAYVFCTSSSYFNISSIDVTGNKRVTTQSVLDACGIREGMNSVSANVHSMEKILLQIPWIETVSIRRELPGSIKISIREREPAFLGKKKDKLFYVSSKGKAIAPVESKNFISLPILEIGPGGEEALPLIPEFLEHFQTAGFPFSLAQISWFRISAGSGFELYWESRQLRLSIGIENWKENIKRIASVVVDIEHRKETQRVTGIRSADGQVWMTKENEE